MICFVVFFFKQKTAYDMLISDWSSDVCSSDLTAVLTRLSDDGVGPCVDVRARALNAAQVDVAIDIHADGGPASGRGFTILRPVPSGVNDSVVAPSREIGRA